MGGAQCDRGCGAEAVGRRRRAVVSIRRFDLRDFIAGDLGIRPNFYMDVFGGGSSTEALVGMAIGLIEAGMCKCVAIFRAMNGFSQVRIGGTGARAAAPVLGDALHGRAYGWQSAGQMFSPTFMRHMYDYGTRPEQVAHVKHFHSCHASNNPKAFYKQRFTVDDVLNSRIICKPLHLLDCCVETDNGTALIVTSARAPRLPPYPRADPRRGRPLQQAAHRHALPAWPDLHRRRPLCARHPVAERGVGPEDIDVTGSYDAFTFTTMLQLEDYGFCKKGEAVNTSATARSSWAQAAEQHQRRHLCEGYTHGLNMVIENVRQLRHDVDDSCPIGPDGKRQHSYDYREGGCRQVKDCELSANLGWANPGTGSAMVMRRG